MPPGLSTWRLAEHALADNAKAQVIDLNRLLVSNQNLQAIEEAGGHVTITTQDWESLIEWSSVRGVEGAQNPLAQSIQNSIIGQLR
jgi:hypothetical protein